MAPSSSQRTWYVGFAGSYPTSLPCTYDKFPALRSWAAAEYDDRTLVLGGRNMREVHGRDGGRRLDLKRFYSRGSGVTLLDLV
jgi:hypothetical protein